MVELVDDSSVLLNDKVPLQLHGGAKLSARDAEVIGKDDPFLNLLSI